MDRTKSVPRPPSLFPSEVAKAQPQVAEKLQWAHRNAAGLFPARGPQLFGKAILKEAIEILPKLPETESLDEIKSLSRSHLHFSAQQTRRRNADYIIRRMFPFGYSDWPMRAFAKHFSGSRFLGRFASTAL